MQLVRLIPTRRCVYLVLFLRTTDRALLWLNRSLYVYEYQQIKLNYLDQIAIQHESSTGVPFKESSAMKQAFQFWQSVASIVLVECSQHSPISGTTIGFVHSLASSSLCMTLNFFYEVHISVSAKARSLITTFSMMDTEGYIGSYNAGIVRNSTIDHKGGDGEERRRHHHHNTMMMR